MNAACHTYDIGMLQIGLGHVTHMNAASVCPQTHAHMNTEWHAYHLCHTYDLQINCSHSIQVGGMSARVCV